MVKRSKKSKSKRVTLRKKYKVIKKVKQHHKKKAKEAKKSGKQKPKVEKDPGIPNAWPFKEQEIQNLEEKRARVIKELEEKKQAKKERAREKAEKRKLGIMEEDAELSELVRRADARANEFDTKRKKAKHAATQDGSKRAYYKELLKVIEASDVIIQVLDARDPLGTRCPDVERLVIKSASTKRIVLLLNKIDLVPKEVAEKWVKYLREELPTVAFKCSTQKQKANLGQKKSKSRSKEVPETSECLGAETLLQLLKNYSRNQELKTSITVGVVGLPNAGKSSLINSLKRTRAVSTGATPGLTKAMQEVQLDKHVKLLDCPGVVLASASDAGTSVNLRNCVKLEKLADPVSPVSEILRLCSAERLMSIYKISSFSTVDEFLQLVAVIRGKIKKGGVVDTEAAARIVLYEWNEGKIPHYTLPPVRESSLEHNESAIVSEWAKEFNVDEVFKSDQSIFAGCSLADHADPVELLPNAPVSLDVTMMEESADEGDEVEAPVPSAMDTNEGAALPGSSEKVEKIPNQTEKLYNAEGIYNPRLARAERKKKKKFNAAGGAEVGTDTEKMDVEAYDFNVDYVQDDQANGGDKNVEKVDKTTTKKSKKRSKSKPRKKNADENGMQPEF